MESSSWYGGIVLRIHTSTDGLNNNDTVAVQVSLFLCF